MEFPRADDPLALRAFARQFPARSLSREDLVAEVRHWSTDPLIAELQALARPDPRAARAKVVRRGLSGGGVLITVVGLGLSLVTGGAFSIVLSTLGAAQTGASEYWSHRSRRLQALQRKRGFAAFERLEELSLEMQSRILLGMAVSR